jgi:hypothetical protein
MSLHRLFSYLAAQACLALIFLSYPLFLQAGAHNGKHETAQSEQFDFCELLPPRPSRSCRVTTRYFVREIQSQAGDPRACVQASTTAKFFLHPWQSGNWDKTTLVGYAAYYRQSSSLYKRLKAQFAEYMLSRHRDIDALCGVKNLQEAQASRG